MEAPDAGVVAAVGLLDLDDVGAHVGQQYTGEGTGQAWPTSITRTPSSGRVTMVLFVAAPNVGNRAGAIG